MMIAKILYLTVFLAGLALGVHVMLHGVERWRRRRSRKPSAAFNPPTVSAFAIGIGASGYLFSTRSSLSALIVFLISICIGAAAFAGATILMAKWALRNAQLLPSDEDDVSGQVATVSRAIGIDEPGEITWYAWDQRHVLPAIGIGEMDIPAGAEVVIDIVEEGVARVELWSVVEGRL